MRLRGVSGDRTFWSFLPFLGLQARTNPSSSSVRVRASGEILLMMMYWRPSSTIVMLNVGLKKV